MRTKNIKASNVRIGDKVYGYGTVETITHLSRDLADMYFEENTECFTVAFGTLVEVVTHSNGKAV